MLKSPTFTDAKIDKKKTFLKEINKYTENGKYTQATNRYGFY